MNIFIEDESRRKIKVEIRPLSQNGPLQAGTVDEIKATMEGLRLSPTAVVGYLINEF